MKAFISSIAYYLPDFVLDNQMLSKEHPEWEAEKISQKTGIYQRHIAAKDEFAGDMALQAAKKLFAENEIRPSSIDFILYCTQSPDYFLPTTACILQDKLGIPTTSGALDFNLGCSGYIYGLALAKGLLISRIANRVLLITSETYSKYIHARDKSNKTIFGDAASATLISKDDGVYEIGEFSFGTDGRGAENLMVKAGGTRFKDAKGLDVLDEGGFFVRNDENLFMNGPAIFSFTSSSVPKLVDQVIKANKLALNEIDYFLFHQANRYMLDFIRKKIGIAQEKFIYYLENVGNTVSSTIPIALKEECLDRQKHGTILLAGFGVGYSWGGCTIKTVSK